MYICTKVMIKLLHLNSEHILATIFPLYIVEPHEADSSYLTTIEHMRKIDVTTINK